MNSGILYFVLFTISLFAAMLMESRIDTQTMKRGGKVSHLTGGLFYGVTAFCLWLIFSINQEARNMFLASSAAYGIALRTLFFNLLINKQMGWKTWYVGKTDWFDLKFPLKPWHRVGLYMGATLWLVSDIYDVYGTGVEWFLAALIAVGAIFGMITVHNE